MTVIGNSQPCSRREKEISHPGSIQTFFSSCIYALITAIVQMATDATTIYVTSTSTQTAITTLPPETTSGIVTAWIPLTTTAPPPYSACWNESFTNDYDTHAFDSVPVAFDPDFGFQNGSSYIICQPDEVASWFHHPTASSTTGDFATVTSIQPVVCPSMWSTAFTSTVRNSVQVTCCPKLVP